jgi:ATP-dependent protease ClpP protease subunit
MTHAITDGRGYALAKAEEGSPTPTLYLYDVLGVDVLGGIAARQVVEDLAALGTAEALDVRVNSPGGDVFEGIAVYNALVRFPGKVTVHVDGLAASIASLVALAGDRTFVAENAMLMVHRPWTAVVGDAEDMRQQAAILDKAWTAMLATYARGTGRRAESLAQKVEGASGEWWMTAEEAIAAGFADAVEKPTKAAAVFGLARFRHVPERLAASAAEAAAPPAAVRVAEIAVPRASRAASAEDRAAARRRVVDVLRLGA